MGQVVTIGLDIAKSVFQVHGVDALGAVMMRRRLTRSRMLAFFAKTPPCRSVWKRAGRATIGRVNSPAWVTTFG